MLLISPYQQKLRVHSIPYKYRTLLYASHRTLNLILLLLDSSKTISYCQNAYHSLDTIYCLERMKLQISTPMNKSKSAMTMESGTESFKEDVNEWFKQLRMRLINQIVEESFSAVVGNIADDLPLSSSTNQF